MLLKYYATQGLSQTTAYAHALLLATAVLTLVAAAVASDELVVGAAEGAEAVAEVVARLLRERLQLKARALPLHPAACTSSPLDSPACLTALTATLRPPTLPLPRRTEVWCVVGVAAGAGALRGVLLWDAGELAPPAARTCLVSRSAGSDPPASHADLRRNSTVAPYELNEHELRLADELARDPFTARYYCEGKDWLNGTFIPEWCQHDSCATLLVGAAPEAQLIARDVRRWRWRVRVLALGPRLAELVRKLTSRPLLLCAWAPMHSELASSLGDRFEPLAMPPCAVNRADNVSDCHYESRRLLKLVEARAAARQPRALRLLERVFFTLDEYRILKELHVATKSAKVAAERWLATHEYAEKRWVAAGVREVRVGVMVPVSGGSSLQGLELAAAARLAETDAMPALLELGFRFKTETYDDACSARRAVKYVTDALGSAEFGTLAALVGPGCASALSAAAAQAHAFRLPVVAYTAVPRVVPEPMLILVGGEARRAAVALGALVTALGWRRLAVLTEASLRALADPGLLHADVLLHRELPEPLDENNYQIIDEWAAEVAARDGRVLLVATQQALWVRAALCAGRRYGLQPSTTAWLLPGEITPIDLQPTARDKHGCNVSQLLKMAEGYLSAGNEWLSAAATPPEAWVSRWRAACAELMGAVPAALAPPEPGCVSPPLHAALLYDAVLALAKALRTLLLTSPTAADDLHDIDFAGSLVQNLIQQNYTGLTGELRLDETGERTDNIDLWQWWGERRQRVGSWRSSRLSFDADKLHWTTVDGHVPEDGSPHCALQSLAAALHADCQGAIATVAGVVVVLLAMLLLTAFLHCKWRYERRLRARLRALGLRALPVVDEAGRWELPREHVVINRKLGVGAFGTVYGGHALLPDGRWSAVAVKTLKPGAPVEDKLDFLSEAEVMKRLNHENVVRLLGVVTATEPVCSVMEFVLYGDLKNYLLARRHLVDGEDTADEVSSRRLTAMARDSARALAYLADLKYVHRDVAARNCLVGAARVVKLADFGMARRVCETDYYRFSRRGPLPVRWMAPESIALGLFSPPSDVWAFGVLLYEIVTFGALPYQGLANGEVLKLVKHGGAPRLPSGVTSRARALMETCWHREPRARPTAAELAATLADDPHFLTPCLDIPFDMLPMDEEPWGMGEGRVPGYRRDTSGSMTAAHDHDTDTTYLSDEPVLVVPTESDHFLS